MPSVFSTWAILLDRQQGLCGAGRYCVYRTGERADLRKLAGTHHDSSVAGWKQADFTLQYGEPILMLDRNGQPAPGQISKLTYAASLPASRMSLD